MQLNIWKSLQCVKACIRNVHQSTPGLNTFSRRNVPLKGINAAQQLKKLASWQCVKACVRTLQSTPNIKPVCWQSMKSFCAPLYNNVLLITLLPRNVPSQISAAKRAYTLALRIQLDVPNVKYESTDHIPSRIVTEC